MASDTLGFSLVETLRKAGISTSADGDALLALDGFDSGVVYEEPQEVTVTNQTGVVLDDNEVSSAAGDLRFRQPGSDDSSDTLQLDDLTDGENDSFEIVTAPDRTGEVTDTVTLSYGGSGGVSIEVVRDITVEFNAGGQLVYVVNGSIQVYDAVNDNLRTPPHSTTPEVIGATAVDIVDDSNADLPYTDNGRTVYATWVGADSDTVIYDGNNPKPKKQKTRLSVGPWPPSSLSGDLVLSAAHNSSSIIGISPDGTTDTLADVECDGVAGVEDIDGDGELELVYVNGSQQIYYLEQDGTTRKIENGGVGSNNSTGFGPPADFGRGRVEIPFVDGSNDPALIDSEGNKYRLNSNGIAKKAAVAPVDIDGDGALEFMFLDSGTGEIRYIDDVGGSNSVETLEIDGSTVTPDEKVGLNSGA